MSHLNSLAYDTIDLYCIVLYGLSHKDWELSNSRIWLAEIDIENGFPI